MSERGVYGQVSDLLAAAMNDLAIGKVFEAIDKTERATFIMRDAQSIRSMGYLAPRPAAQSGTGGE